MWHVIGNGVGLFEGDCLDAMRCLPDNSVDSIVTDPPYGLNFMGNKWDYDVPSVDIWRECLRVLKPGGYLLAFAGTRTQHRMAVRIEDAGFEIRDMIAWVYGSGMPKHKSLLKPAMEPITLARKPATTSTLLNIEACRVPINSESDQAEFENNHRVTERLPQHYDGQSLGLHGGGWKQRVGEAVIPKGRYPANVIHDGSDEVLAAFPEVKGQQGNLLGHDKQRKSPNGCYGETPPASDHVKRGDSGSAARFFYCAKATKKDRGEGNTHNTVKPTDLMRYLCRLVTPTGGVVFDPFAGSGSTGKAAVAEGFKFFGAELQPEYVKIAAQRIKSELEKTR